jgi:hypothetical protein
MDDITLKMMGYINFFWNDELLRCECTKEDVTWNLGIIIGENSKHFEQKQNEKKRQQQETGNKRKERAQPTNQTNSLNHLKSTPFSFPFITSKSNIINRSL